MTLHALRRPRRFASSSGIGGVSMNAKYTAASLRDDVVASFAPFEDAVPDLVLLVDAERDLVFAVAIDVAAREKGVAAHVLLLRLRSEERLPHAFGFLREDHDRA